MNPDLEVAGLVVQTLAVLAAVFAGLAALKISADDRRNSREIAAADRLAALEQAKLMFDLEALLRLAENQNRGGSTDPLETARLGAEALALVSLIGPERLPRLYARRIPDDDAAIRAKLEDNEADTPEWVKWKIETTLALREIVGELDARLRRS